MSSIGIIDASRLNQKLNERPSKITPVYLILAEDPSIKSKLYKFISVKMDEFNNTIKVIGFETDKDIDTICQNYQEIVNSTDKILWKEMTMPWHRIIRIQNLIFKSK